MKRSRTLAAFDTWCQGLERDDLISVRSRLIAMMQLTDRHLEDHRQADPHQWDSCFVFWPAVGIFAATAVSVWNWM